MLAREGLEGSVLVSGWFSCVGGSCVCVDRVERASVRFLLECISSGSCEGLRFSDVACREVFHSDAAHL